VIPLKDENSTLSTPILSYAIIGICVVVFLIQISSPGFDNGHLFYSYGVVPSYIDYFNVYAWRLYAFDRKYALYVDLC
jgi:membrane associated rhomboid family serine protease